MSPIRNRCRISFGSSNPRIRPLLLSFAMAVASANLAAQTVSTVQDGDWNSPSTWNVGFVPDPTNSDSVVVLHRIVIGPGSWVTIDDLTVSGHLSIEAGANLNVIRGNSQTDLTVRAQGQLSVWGTLICQDGARIQGTTSSNTFFLGGSIYTLLSKSEGSIPIANWDPNSTFQIMGIEGNITMQSANWGQTFGNMIYDCPAQGAFVEFKGLLSHMGGNFTVSNTNRSILRLAQSQQFNLRVDGNVTIEGPSEVWFGMSGNSSVMVAGDFNYRSGSTASSYFTTVGETTISIEGDFTLDAIHRLKMASSTASGHTDLIVNGDFNLLHGKLDALGTGSGTLVFAGSSMQEVVSVVDDNTGFEGNISFRIDSLADVNLDRSLLSNSTGGDFDLAGTVRLRSLNQDGVLQSGTSGNIQVNGPLTFRAGSRVIFDAAGMQFLRYDDFGESVVVINNTTGITLLNDIQFNDVAIENGNLDAGAFTVGIGGDLLIGEGGGISTNGTFLMNGHGDQLLDVRGDTLRNLYVENMNGANVRLLSPLFLLGELSVLSKGSDFVSDGYLTLLSTSERPGSTASIGTLPVASAVVGPVTVQRFIQRAEGKYRYISSAVNNSPVSSLMDDIPVTGIFEDPSEVPDGGRNAPSLFYYDEQMSMWQSFPTSGTADTNFLMPGKGYSIYNWNGSDDTIWDVTGEINQGELDFDLTYTPGGNEELDGWNLIGNPYPSAIRWSDQGWERSEDLGLGIAVRDNLLGEFRYWDGETGSLTGGIIAPGQSFWVRAAGPSPLLRIDESAKAAAGAEYYRKTRRVSYIELEAVVGGLKDKAYMRLRDGATDSFDRYDTPKLANDSLSLSFRTIDSVEVAIYALDKMACRSQIPMTLNIENRGMESILFRLRTEGLFRASRFCVLDLTSGSRYEFDKDGSLTIPRDAGTGGFSFLSESGLVVEKIAVDADTVVCAGDTLRVRIETPRPGIGYYLENSSSILYPIPDGSKSTVAFLSDSLAPTRKAYRLIAASSCSAPVVLDTLFVRKVTVDLPDPRDGYHCGPGRVEIEAFTRAPNQEILWYADSTGSIPTGQGPQFLTRPLRKSRTYYSSAIEPHGCESPRRPVLAEIRPAVDPEMINLDSDFLTVEHLPGAVYQWYFEGVPLTDESDHFVKPELPGTYSLVAAKNGCSSWSDFQYGAECDHVEPSVAVFPNPCRDRLFLRIHQNLENPSVVILDFAGRETRTKPVRTENGWKIDCSDLAVGCYILRVAAPDFQRHVRFVKLN